MKHSKLAKIFKALSNEQRLKLFMMIYKECCCASKKRGCCGPIDKAFTKACGCMDLSRSTLSHHFKELQNAGLISCSRNGQSYLCEVNESVIAEVREFLD